MSAFPRAAGATVQCRNGRHSNEDRFMVVDACAGRDIAFFGVFDGHGGDACSEFLANNLFTAVAKSPAFEQGDYIKALCDGLLSAEHAFKNEFTYKHAADPLVDHSHDEQCNDLDQGSGGSAGSCALAALRVGGSLFIANVGDCRAVAGVQCRSKVLTRDHKPNDPSEKARVVGAGGFIKSNRVFGLLAVTRSIGDFEFKLDPLIGTLIPNPETYQEEITPEHQCVIMACDGLWDTVDNALAVEHVLEQLRSGKSTEETARSLVRLAVERGSKDDVTAIVIPLNPHPKSVSVSVTAISDCQPC